MMMSWWLHDDVMMTSWWNQTLSYCHSLKYFVLFFRLFLAAKKSSSRMYSSGTDHYLEFHFKSVSKYMSEQLTRTFAVLVWKFVVSLAPDKHHCLFWVLWRTLCYGPAQSGQGQLLPLASPLVGRAPGDCGGWDRPRHHQYLLLRKHRQGLQGEGNSLWICSSSSGTHRNIQQSSRSHSGKNNWQNVNSKGKITISTPKPTWTL